MTDLRGPGRVVRPTPRGIGLEAPAREEAFRGMVPTVEAHPALARSGQGPRSDGVRERHFHCRRCGRDHPGRDSEGHLVECYSCGLSGHRAFECRSRKGGSSHSRLGATPGAQTATRSSKETKVNGGSKPSGGRGLQAG
ncbi:uncharacterized protein LOC116005633 [Ipomoea triloba]|uniref:uncharacterized protein LOC116005633 n=1 Tax=Ipomoea triloba TaxID=35885 RepID=UPI00125DB00E|nr:uncharacterized protein LOC116005633 [Ipomoea triloba]